ncbi:peptidylprolyl isomerase [Yoonia sp. SS1-5]|uniref:Parvulin-like PPIase n=1 Tax=Yoonia rhodophyticola TaxID=3137370 RepID=A0AAN0MJ64_9RHOB
MIHIRNLLTLAFALILTVSLASTGQAQGQFSPVITVNDRAITGFELAQRKRLLEFFRTAGDLDEQARNGLIEDRLKAQELERAGLRLTDEALTAAMEEFAGRANMDLAQFTRVLSQNGIDISTLEDFVRIGTSWRDYIRSRYSRQVTISDTDVERAIARRGSSTTEIQVLLNEIIIAAPPNLAARAAGAADRISRLRSFSAFEAAAREVSALPTRDSGGRLPWLPITNYPAQLRGVILDLRPGEVTQPINIPNGIALFQMRGVREVARSVAAPSSIDYAIYNIPGGRTEAALQQAARIARDVDTCDDLYGIAQGQPAEVLERLQESPSDIPNDIALELARLDPGEVSYNVARNGGQTLAFVMLCSRNTTSAEDADPEAVRNQIRGQRLAGLADALLEDLRAAAIIRTQ